MAKKKDKIKPIEWIKTRYGNHYKASIGARGRLFVIGSVGESLTKSKGKYVWNIHCKLVGIKDQFEVDSLEAGKKLMAELLETSIDILTK